MNAGYGSLIAHGLHKSTTGKTFFVTDPIGVGASAQLLHDIFPVDNDGVVRVHNNFASALAATVAGRWDVIVIANDFTTAPTDAELTTAGTNWVSIVQSGANTPWNEVLVTGSSKTLPASTTGTLFAVTGVVEIVAIVWVVTTAIQDQACNLKLSTVSNSATTDVCSNLDIADDAAQSRMSITGTFANALINTAPWVPVARQATSFIAQQWNIIATTTATNTGAIRWSVLYRPIQAWSKVVAA